MKYNRREIGGQYEKRAGEYLEKKGFRVLQYNFFCRSGEIDLIAADGEYLVFCEVKYRRNAGSGHPSEAVDIRKQKKISRCALYYLTKTGQVDIPCRFDVVCVEGEKITHIENAFDFVG